MTDLGLTAGVGQRIQSIRKRRGIKSAADLAAAIPGNVISAATIQNIEAGRKIDVSVSQVFNIAYALKVAPIYLLVDIRNPNAIPDLPGLSDDLNKMTAVEFDAWSSGALDGAFEWDSADEQSERSQLAALRELETLAKERDRLARLIKLGPQLDGARLRTTSDISIDQFAQRKIEVETHIRRLATYLSSAGWATERWTQQAK